MFRVREVSCLEYLHTEILDFNIVNITVDIFPKGLLMAATLWTRVITRVYRSEDIIFEMTFVKERLEQITRMETHNGDKNGC